MNMVLYQTHGVNILYVIIFVVLVSTNTYRKHYIFENIMV
jgi:hypothetical protein